VIVVRWVLYEQVTSVCVCDLHRVMAALNFLRYLLIRDQPADNRVGHMI